ncbi:MAG TPA: alcohol dehydrogenase [Candidatus Sulfotelmatobacter sp.]|nr:alcohol dehydrogenase [Candidatus Sulfotelmatobacter sp.]
MHSMQIIEWGKPLEARDRPNPKPQGSEVLLKVTACGVCHSDLHLLDGFFDLGGGRKLELGKLGVKLPHTLGHEIVGEVVAFGPEAAGVAIGDKRLAHPWIGCGACDFCRRGEELQCGTLKSLGARTDGGYADHVLVPHPRYLIDYAGVPAELACTYTCSGVTAYSALKKLADLPERDTVVIIGAGGVGLNAVMLAKAVLKCRFVVADIDPLKREAALKAGAAAVFDNADPEAVAKLKAMTASGAGAGGAIDFVGAPASAQFGVDCLRKGGTLVIVGLYGGATPIPLPLFPQRILTVRGSYVGDLQDIKELMALVKAGKVPPIPITVRPLAEINQILAELRAGKVLGRVVVQPAF